MAYSNNTSRLSRLTSILLKLQSKPFVAINQLAKQVEAYRNQLLRFSWLLNESLGKKINEFINHYRVQTFKSLAKDPANANITVLGLAYDSTFNSKTVFNIYFKKETGLTSSQFLKA